MPHVVLGCTTIASCWPARPDELWAYNVIMVTPTARSWVREPIVNREADQNVSVGHEMSRSMVSFARLQFQITCHALRIVLLLSRVRDFAKSHQTDLWRNNMLRLFLPTIAAFALALAFLSIPA